MGSYFRVLHRAPLQSPELSFRSTGLEDPHCSYTQRHFLSHSSVPLSFTSYDIHYITPITRHCHASILPSTGQENNLVQPK